MNKLFPELNRLDDKAERRKLYNEAARPLVRQPLFWVALLLGPVVVALTLVFGFLALRPYLPRVPQPVLSGIIGGVIGGSAAGALQYLFRRPIQREIRRLLNERGIPICVQCGYDLRGADENAERCPECGTPPS